MCIRDRRKADRCPSCPTYRRPARLSRRHHRPLLPCACRRPAGKCCPAGSRHCACWRPRSSAPTGRVSYLDFLAPGILAQSALFIAIFYGIQIIWERDAGVLTKLLVTPTPRAALVTGKAFAAGVRATCQVIVVLVISALLGATLTVNPLKLLATVGVVVLGAAFFSCLSMTIAGLVLKRDRLMGIGQAITMPLFFASNALYPIQLMPHWLQTVSRGNPLSYEVDALRGLLTGTPARLPLDIAVLTGAAVTAIAAAAALLGRLAR